MKTILIAIIIFGIAMLIMAVGVFFGRRCLRGSCHASDPIETPDGEKLLCPRCEREVGKPEK